MKKFLNVIAAIATIAIISCCFISCDGSAGPGPAPTYSITSAPHNVTVSMAAKPNTVNISWDAATEASGAYLAYTVYYGTTNSFSNATIIGSGSSSTCSMTVTFPSPINVEESEDNATQTETYFFFVKASVGQVSAVSEAKEFDVVYSQLPKPTNVQYTRTVNNGTASYTITWNSSDTVDGYYVYERSRNGPSSSWSSWSFSTIDVTSPLQETNYNSSLEYEFAIVAYQRIFYYPNLRTSSGGDKNYSKKVTAINSQE